MKRLCLLFHAAVLLLLVADASAQAPLVEAPALAAKAAGDFRAAGDAFLQLLAQLGHERGDTATAALAEHAAAMALDLERYAPAGAGPATAVLAAADSPLAAQQPWLADRLRVLALALLARRGDAAAPALAAACGCLSDFWLCGPFDNERGGGFRSPHGPEKFRLDATYDGKRRPQGWRHLGVAAPTGRVDLDELLRPGQQVLAYAALALVADDDRDLALCLGTSGSWRVWLNGSELAARDVQRTFAFDQDAVVLPLRKGANLLLLELCNQEAADFTFAARVRGLDGAPARSVRASAEAAVLRTAAATAARTPATAATPSLGARDVFAAAAAAGDAAAALRAGTLLLLARSDGDQDRRDVRLLQQAVAGLPDCVEARLRLAQARVRVVASEADRDENERRQDIAGALALQPTHVEALLEAGWLEMASTGMAQRGEELGRKVLAVNGRSALGHMLVGDALSALGNNGLSRAELRLAAADHAPAVLFQRLAQQLEGDEDFADAIPPRQQAALYGALPERLELIRLLLRTGATAAGKAMLAQTIALEPYDRKSRMLLADLQAAEGDVPAALRSLAAWLELCPEDDAALVAVANLQCRSGDTDKQREALRAALELNPNQAAVQRYVDYLAAEETPFFAASKLDGDAVIAADAGPPADAAEAKDPLHYLLLQRVVRAYRNGTTSEYQHRVVRILSEEGSRQLQHFALPYHRGDQRARLLACAVHKHGGGVQRPQLHGASVSLAGLQIGDVVDLEGRVDDLAPTFFGDYFGLEHAFAAPDGSPVARSLLTVIAEAGRDYRWQASNGAPEPQRSVAADGAEVFTVAMTALPRDVPEPRRPSFREREPLLRISTYRDWDHFAAWWWDLIQRQREVTPAMRQKVAELCAGCTDVPARIAAIYRFVTTEVRYEAWEFGVHGYKPYSTAVIFERRHGDCKDKALLLTAMLAEIGVHAAPVLIWADGLRSADDLSLPLVSHFNHCIAWLPPQDGRPGCFLDGTAVWHPVDTLPEMDQGARVVVVDDGKATIRTVPFADPAADLNDEVYRIALRDSGDASVALSNRPRGNQAIALRVTLGTEPARQQEQLERWLLPRLGKLTLAHIVASDPLALDRPVDLQADAEVSALAQKQGSDLLLPSDFAGEGLVALTAEPQRRTPLLLGLPWTSRQQLRYRLPPGYRVDALPAAVAADTPFGGFKMDWQRAGDEIVVQRELVLKTPRVQPADYASFRDFVATVKAADDRRLVAKKQEAGR